MNPIIIDQDTKRELWPARDCARFLGISRATWVSYTSRKIAPGPVATLHGLTLWDSAEVRDWHATRPGQGNWRR